jgi:hypothetical protein
VCTTGRERCVDGGACIDTVSDDSNCGGCGIRCDAGTKCRGSQCR